MSFGRYRSVSSSGRVGVKASVQESEFSSQLSDGADLPERIEEAYKRGETDGILTLAHNLPLEKQVPEDLISATVEVSRGNKGQTISILNSWIGACILTEDPDLGARLAWGLLSAFDDVSEELSTYPDLVTLSLAYTAFRRGLQTSAMAEDVLERAIKLGKKLGGSKRRKSLAASRRQKVIVEAKDVEKKLQFLYGSDFQILQETEDFLVLSKPSGMVCFHKHKTTAGKIKKKKGKSSKRTMDISLEDALLDQKIPLSALNHESRGLVHRIDRGTSGCIVLAKTDDMHARLLSEFFLRRAKKSYSALVSADASIPNEGTLNTPVTGRPAKSSFEVIERYSNLVSLLKVATFTGRKHQVRVHCAEGLNAPILVSRLLLIIAKRASFGFSHCICFLCSCRWTQSTRRSRTPAICQAK